MRTLWNSAEGLLSWQKPTDFLGGGKSYFWNSSEKGDTKTGLPGRHWATVCLKKKKKTCTFFWGKSTDCPGSARHLLGGHRAVIYLGGCENYLGRSTQNPGKLQESSSADWELWKLHWTGKAVSEITQKVLGNTKGLVVRWGAAIYTGEGEREFGNSTFSNVFLMLCICLLLLCLLVFI